ncbi:MAG: hypothetical protein KKE44_23280 [Proteobacteria bacterium]|nr:hypothetical protein [Pseudomonadota bacterium]MBU1585659.1 hypothetical protein [Pseudomonadota bacterium]MBU2454009.1 hypothetical protein [Pseudomonadota bacterium]MBU2630326.1 hypothetical protein [Pseudomonadota bacterium]
MSIIFEKLKTLKNRSSEQEDLKHPKLQHQRNVYTFKRLIFSPMGALLIFATLVGFGLISFYALSFLKGYLDSSSNNAIVVQHQKADRLPGDDMLLPQEDGLEAPPGSEPATGHAAAPGAGPPSPGDPLASKKPDKFKVPEYFMHQAKDKTGTDMMDIPDAPQNVPILPLKNQFLPSLKSVYSPVEKTAKTFDHLSPSAAADISTPAVQPALQTNRDKTSDPEVQKENTPVFPPLKTVSLEEKKEALQEVARLAKQKRTKKISDIASLAADLEDAIEKNDIFRTNTLLDQLTGNQDNTSAYYLKLKAFKEIRQENYAFAKTLLNKVLAKDNTDFEANINMAIIEIREQKLENARQRLIRLKDLYPSQSAIDDLLNML